MNRRQLSPGSNPLPRSQAQPTKSGAVTPSKASGLTSRRQDDPQPQFNANGGQRLGRLGLTLIKTNFFDHNLAYVNFHPSNREVKRDLCP